MTASREWKEQIDAERVRAGVCRHCAGPVPCWSQWGDQVPGVRHSQQSWAAANEKVVTQFGIARKGAS